MGKKKTPSKNRKENRAIRNSMPKSELNKLDKKTADFVFAVDKYLQTSWFMFARRWALKKHIKTLLYG